MTASRRRNVQQQNHDTWMAIRDRAISYRTNPQHNAWLKDVLIAHGLSSDEGILVSLRDFMDQLGMCYAGLWLSSDRRFFRFSVLFPRQSDQPMVIEDWRETTDEFPVNAHQPGTGKSFGFLAVKVLDELAAS